MLAAVLLFIGCILIFIRIADENVLEKNYDFDTKVAAYVEDHNSAGLVKAAEVISFFGSPPFLLSAYILLILFMLWKGKKKYALGIAILGLSSRAVILILKEAFKRERPLIPSGEFVNEFSFPSGHTVSSFIFCGILLYFSWKLAWKLHWKMIIAIVLVLFSVAIAISRLVLNVHYATDVIAGLCLAIVWLLLSLFIMEKIRKKVPAAL